MPTYSKLKRLFLGQPLLSQSQAENHSIPKWRAVVAFSSDVFSSVAYGIDEILIPLLLAGAGALAWSIPVAMTVCVLLTILVFTYREKIDAYPTGGTYSIVRENLGIGSGLTVAAALLIDYVMTLAVSAVAAVAALVSAFPQWIPYRQNLAFLFVVALVLLNLRGDSLFSKRKLIATYLFIVVVFALIAGGIYKMLHGQLHQVHPVIHEFYPPIAIFLVLRAFSAGAVTLTGIESISNQVSLFQNPMQKNAKNALTIVALLLMCMFLGLTLLAHYVGATPTLTAGGRTVISQIAEAVYGRTAFFYVVQLITAWVLLVAANTSFSRFPRLASQLALDRFMPRQFAAQGDKLVYSNAIIGLGVAAGIVVLFLGDDTHDLIPLYAVGAFLSYTLVQLSLALRHIKNGRNEKQRSLVSGQFVRTNWRRRAFICAFGAFVTGGAALLISVTKFVYGAWGIALLIAGMVYVFTRIYEHYEKVSRELSLEGMKPDASYLKVEPHTVIIPISGLHRGVLDALRYALSISSDVRACYVDTDPTNTERMQELWGIWVPHVPLIILKSPYRSVIGPLIDYVSDVERLTHDEMLTVIIPEFVTQYWFQRFLHNQTAFLIRTALMLRKGRVVTSVRYYLKGE